MAALSHAALAATLHAQLDHATRERRRLHELGAVEPVIRLNPVVPPLGDYLEDLSAVATRYLGISVAALALGHARQAGMALGSLEGIIDSIEYGLNRQYGLGLPAVATGNVAGALILGAIVPAATLHVRLGRSLDGLHRLLKGVHDEIVALWRLVIPFAENSRANDADTSRQFRLIDRFDRQCDFYDRAVARYRDLIEGRPTGFYSAPALLPAPRLPDYG